MTKTCLELEKNQTSSPSPLVSLMLAAHTAETRLQQIIRDELTRRGVSGISPDNALILLHIGHQTDVRCKEVPARGTLPERTVYDGMRKLEAADYVRCRRDEEWTTVILMELTEAGLQLYQQLVDTIDKRCRSLAADHVMATKRLQQTEALLETLCR